MCFNFNRGQLQDDIPTLDPRRSISHDKVTERPAAWSVMNNYISKVLCFYKQPKLPANRAAIMQRHRKLWKVRQDLQGQTEVKFPADRRGRVRQEGQ